MIFVTVGSAEPFDRMIRAIDQWVPSHRRDSVFAQIGNSEYEPQNFKSVRFLTPPQFREHVGGAELIVAHAGMGSIITALELGKPIIVMPRRQHFHETRSDHQVATAQHFEQRRSVVVAVDEKDLIVKLDSQETLEQTAAIRTEASPELISTIRAFILNSRGADTGQRNTRAITRPTAL